MKKAATTLMTATLILTAIIPYALRAAAQTPPAPKASAAAPHKTAAAAAPAFDRALLRPALLKAEAPEVYKVKFTTLKGDFVITVTRAWAPIGADRFYNLARHHFYDRGNFFRVLKTPPFMAQFGLSAYPAVSAAWHNSTIKDDLVTQSNQRGFISFATAGPNTRTTQVFINYGDNRRLDAMGFAPFGQVTEGMEVVDQLYGDYGEGAPSGAGPDQELIEKQGKPYLDKGWPKLDLIISTTVIGAPATAIKKPVAKPGTPAEKNP
jgi:peptidyl-prolyl cis-trans isomerase A (cyclophilin A)